MAKESPNHHQTLTGRETTLSQNRTLSSTPRPEDNSIQIPPQSLAEFREREGRANRKRRLYALWQHICRDGYLSHEHRKANLEGQKVGSLTPDGAEKLRAAYEDELLGRCGAQSSRKQIGWTEFKNYAEAKETGTWPSLDISCPRPNRFAELWNIFHNELDLDGNGTLDSQELDSAFRKSGEHVH